MYPTDVGTVSNVSRDMLGMPQQKIYLAKSKDEVFCGFLEPQWKSLPLFGI